MYNYMYTVYTSKWTLPGKPMSRNCQLIPLWALYWKTHVDVQTGFYVSRVGKESPLLRPSPHGDVRWAATPVTKWQDGACLRIACGCQVIRNQLTEMTFQCFYTNCGKESHLPLLFEHRILYLYNLFYFFGCSTFWQWRTRNARKFLLESICASLTLPDQSKWHLVISSDKKSTAR